MSTAALMPTRTASRVACLQELENADRRGRLACSGPLRVTEVTAADAPAVMAELARLREEPCRGVEAGSGLDAEPDTGYRQLLLWDAQAGRIAGGFRLGAVDELMHSGGVQALYSHSLFDFDEAFIAGLQPTVELARSYIHPDYQRHPATLCLLWKAIGAWLLRHPGYRHLIGTVTLSPRYSPKARNLMLAWLAAHAPDGKDLVGVRGRHPQHLAGARDFDDLVRVLPEVEDLDQAIRNFEGGKRGAPVLMRQYLSLGARALAISVDPAPGGATHCLLHLDLTVMPDLLQARHTGPTDGRAWLARERPLLQRAS
ncbi:MAG: GNAT family N-acetyltransferase [Gammaproteobacteria bacterium]|nr:GNAT family N-acetyltransferase [Gammaproteobacteria bacterium]